MVFLVNTNQMTDAEDVSEEKGITRAKLMQNAAKGCFDFIRERFENYRNMSFVLMCGAGNNGGDGIELAFLLTEAGIKATVIITDKMPDTETAKACMKNHKTALKGITLNKHPDRAAAALKKADVIIDCVFGTGFHGELSKELADLFAFADKCKGVKISVDIPSGVSGNSGSIAKGSFKPDITLVMAAVKTGMLNYPCRDFCGEIKVIHIGITSDCYKEFDGVFTPKDITRLLPKRSESAHKGTFGRVLNVAGSKRYRGAAVLSSRGALRAGAGLVTLASVEDVINAAASGLPECVFLNLPESKEGGIGADALNIEKKTTKAAAKTISADAKAFS
ncbi:MAG: NAD(P)H-hydrate epimerase, partial [Ruminiclostridium sp.]|nr:NAD(P)H-hydrate epimerase [Ruminiclostridium sp.]